MDENNYNPSIGTIGGAFVGAAIGLWLGLSMLVIFIALDNLSDLVSVRWPVNAGFWLVGTGVLLAVLTRSWRSFKDTIGMASLVFVTAIGTGLFAFVLYPGGGAEMRNRAISATQGESAADFATAIERMQGQSNLIIADWFPWFFLFGGALVALNGAVEFIKSRRVPQVSP